MSSRTLLTSWLFITASGLALLTPHLAQAKDPSEADFQALSLLGEEIGSWLDGLENSPTSLGLLKIKVHAPLSEDFSSAVESQMLNALTGSGGRKVSVCSECKAPVVAVSGDRIVVTKGAPDQETLQNLAKKIGVDSFISIDVYRTKLSLKASVQLIQASSGELVASESFKVPAVDVFDSAMVIMLNAGPGLTFAAEKNSRENPGVPFAANLHILEEIGFGKAGMSFHGFSSNSTNSLFAVLPTLGWSGRWGATGISSLFNVGSGFSWSSRGWGIGARTSYELFLGSYTNIGIGMQAHFPMGKKKGGAADSTLVYGDFHIGFALGR